MSESLDIQAGSHEGILVVEVKGRIEGMEKSQRIKDTVSERLDGSKGVVLDLAGGHVHVKRRTSRDRDGAQRGAQAPGSRWSRAA